MFVLTQLKIGILLIGKLYLISKLWWYWVGLPKAKILFKILSVSHFSSIFPAGSSIMDWVLEEKLSETNNDLNETLENKITENLSEHIIEL